MVSIRVMETSTMIVSANVVVAKKTRRDTKTSERKTMTNPVLRRLKAILLGIA